ncbi:hypothetical protein DV738_g5235, partial [Chaetothyriales sp. CBS 135597]
MASFNFFALLGILVALALTPTYYLVQRDANTILAHDVYGIDSAVRSLQPAVEAYTAGSGFGAGLINGLPVALGVFKIHVANRKAYIDALISHDLPEDIPAAVKALVAKKPEFEAAGLRDVVRVTLQVLKYDHDSLSDTVKLKLRGPEEKAAIGEAGVKAVDDAIDEGILAYSSS